MISKGTQYLSAAGFGNIRVTAASMGSLDILGTVSGWLSKAARQAILGAFGARDGAAVIAATNAYLNQLAAQGAAGKSKATALAGFINYNADSAVGICQFFYVPELQAAADAGLLNVVQMADNAIYVQILHHHVDNGTRVFADVATSEYNVNSELFSILKYTGTWQLNSKYEFMSEEYYTEGGSLSEQRRWTQTSNPYTDATLSGFVNISNARDGLKKYAESANRCVMYTVPSWWGAMGARSTYNGGLPGINGTSIIKGTLDLWIRVG